MSAYVLLVLYDRLTLSISCHFISVRCDCCRSVSVSRVGGGHEIPGFSHPGGISVVVRRHPL